MVWGELFCHTGGHRRPINLPDFFLAPSTFAAQLARCIRGDVFCVIPWLVHSPCASRRSQGCGTAGLRTSYSQATLCLVARKCSYNGWSDFRACLCSKKQSKPRASSPACRVRHRLCLCKLGWEMQVSSPLCRKQCSYFACRVQMSRQGETRRRL